jgi:16S rRNA (adenine(1408)-N(1))-methyltransferase
VGLIVGLIVGSLASPLPTRRKATKGGLPNVLFIQAAVEDLPAELEGVANEVHIHFPWGSLLRAVAVGERVALRGLRRICASGGLLEVVIGVDPERDRTEIERLGLRPLTLEYVEKILTPLYSSAGFEVIERGLLAASEWPSLRGSWAQRLKSGVDRLLVYIIARAV